MSRMNGFAARRGTLFAAMRARLSQVIFLMTTSCIITHPTEFNPERPVTPPRVRDVRGTTRPRLGNLVQLSESEPDVRFYVPVDDEGASDSLQWKFFINTERDCAPSGDNSCGPQQSGEIAADGTARRYVEHTIRGTLLAVGCNRIELWVSSSFRLDGNQHTPTRAGDVDFVSWWVFKPPSGGATVDPVESCAQRVQP
jgi:hypothetical protein